MRLSKALGCLIVVAATSVGGSEAAGWPDITQFQVDRMAKPIANMIPVVEYYIETKGGQDFVTIQQMICTGSSYACGSNVFPCLYVNGGGSCIKCNGAGENARWCVPTGQETNGCLVDPSVGTGGQVTCGNMQAGTCTTGSGVGGQGGTCGGLLPASGSCVLKACQSS